MAVLPAVEPGHTNDREHGLRAALVAWQQLHFRVRKLGVKKRPMQKILSPRLHVQMLPLFLKTSGGMFTLQFTCASPGTSSGATK